MKRVRDKNYGLKILEAIGDILVGTHNRSENNDDEIKQMTPDELKAFEYNMPR